MLPTFLVIGAAKAGTTSLYEYLRSHPQVFMSAMKEVEFFVAEEHWGRGIGWYEGHFDGAGGALAVGEASPGYTRFPLFSGVPRRIASVLPDVKLIYIVREPIGRIRSQYFAQVAGGWEKRPLDQAVRTTRQYLDDSRYAFQLDQYLEHFDRSQILVIRSDRLSSDPAKTVGRICSFIGVDPALIPETVGARFNTLQDQRTEGAWTKRFHGTRLFNRLQRMTPPAVRNAAWRALTRPADLDLSQEISEETRAYLSENLQDDLRRLAGFFEEPFDAWGMLAPA